MYKILILVTLTLLTSIVSAQTINIDFETNPGPAPISEDGFTLTSNMVENITFLPGSGVVDNGTTIFGWCANDCGSLQTITLSEDSAQLFTLVSIDSANLDIGQIEPGQTIDIVGNLSGGGTVSQSFTLVPDTYTTFNLNSNFTNLTSIDISSNPTSCPQGGLCDIGIDNITVVVEGSAAQAVSVPTLSTWAFIMLILTLGLTATLQFRRV